MRNVTQMTKMAAAALLLTTWAAAQAQSTVGYGRITAVTIYCNGGWDADLRARHAAEAPMVRT